jgi:choline dehydrogenase
VRPVRRKKVVGGTSWLTRFSPRGAPGDYDEWAELGNAGWGWDDVLPYFTRLESDADFGHEPWHGDGGPMPSARYLTLDYSNVAAATIEAAQECGLPWVDDHNRPGAIGTGRMPMNTRHGLRVTTADAYLTDRHANLSVRADTYVDRVSFDRDRAIGVRTADGTELAAGHVVLCAGVYGNPPLLMRSGIGPADHLRPLGIDVRADLPGVGENLADHPAFAVERGYGGALPGGPVLHAISTFHSSPAATDGPPDLMFWFGDPEGDPPEAPIGVLLLKPRSRGRVRLRSADAGDLPIITLPALDDPSDVERLLEGARRAFDVLSRPSVVRVDGTSPSPLPADDAALREQVLAGAWSIPHVVGTCAMGPSPDDGAVVNAQGSVYGVDGLTIADASIMPTVPSGFTHFPTIMIAERLSDTLEPV